VAAPAAIANCVVQRSSDGTLRADVAIHGGQGNEQSRQQADKQVRATLELNVPLRCVARTASRLAPCFAVCHPQLGKPLRNSSTLRGQAHLQDATACSRALMHASRGPTNDCLRPMSDGARCCCTHWPGSARTHLAHPTLKAALSVCAHP